jgi:hypothetical protein
MKPIQPVQVGIICLVVAIAAFYGGVKYDQSKRPAGNFNRQFVTSGGNLQGQNRIRTNTGFRPVVGEVISQDDKSITVKMTDGSSKIVILSDSTNYSKTDKTDKTSLKTGDQVGVFGSDNADGSVTAQTIQLNPQFRMGNGQGNTQNPVR